MRIGFQSNCPACIKLKKSNNKFPMIRCRHSERRFGVVSLSGSHLYLLNAHGYCPENERCSNIIVHILFIWLLMTRWCASGGEAWSSRVQATHLPKPYTCSLEMMNHTQRTNGIGRTKEIWLCVEAQNQMLDQSFSSTVGRFFLLFRSIYTYKCTKSEKINETEIRKCVPVLVAAKCIETQACAC